VLPAGAGDFRLLDRKAVDAINSMGERARFTKGLYAWIGFRARGVPFPGPGATGGQKPVATARAVALWHRWPRLVHDHTAQGLVLRRPAHFLVAFCYAMIFLIKTLIYGTDVPGFPTLVISVMFFAGVQLLSLGIIGEYLGRVYEEVKGRPLFLVAEELGLEKEGPPGAPHERQGRGVRGQGSLGEHMLILCADDYALSSRGGPRRSASCRRPGGCRPPACW
jgi:hypothetical protein